MNGWFEGVVRQGHGVASGVNSESPYTKGTIAIQSPLFKRLGLDLSAYWHGTINLCFKPLEIVLQNPDYKFENMFGPSYILLKHFPFGISKYVCRMVAKQMD